jgi:hypothetical protein
MDSRVQLFEFEGRAFRHLAARTARYSMETSMKQAKLTQMKPSQLKAHPMQGRFFSSCSAVDDEALAADIRLKGQRDPVVVMPPGNAAKLPAYTILDGHRRTQVMLKSAMTAVDVLVRHDLANADAMTVEAEFLNYNLQRRQLHIIDVARIHWRRYEIEKRKEPGQLGIFQLAALKKHIGDVMGVSTKTLDRYFSLLTTPDPVVNAVKNELLKLVTGVKIAALPKREQEEFGNRIDGLTDKAEIDRIAGEYLRGPVHSDGRKATDAFKRLVKHLETDLGDLAAHGGALRPGFIVKHRGALHSAVGKLQQLLAGATDAKPPVPAAEMMARMKAISDAAGLGKRRAG